MNSRRCCQARAPRNHMRESSAMKRMAGALEWVIPGAIVVVMPKCPACVAAYIALGTGVGISFTAAAHLRMTVLILCLTTLAWFAVKAIARVRNREAPFGWRGLPTSRRTRLPARKT